MRSKACPQVGGHPDQILDAQVKQAIDSQRFKRIRGVLSAIFQQLIAPVIGMYDPAVKKLVWIVGLNMQLTQQKQKKPNLNKGAQKLLKDFPSEH